MKNKKKLIPIATIVLMGIVFTVIVKNSSEPLSVNTILRYTPENAMLEHIVLTEIKTYLHQNISLEQMQQFMRKQHEDSIEAYRTESVDCEKRQDHIKIQNHQNYEKYREGQMNQKQFMEAKMQPEEYVQEIYVYDDGRVEMEWR